MRSGTAMALVKSLLFLLVAPGTVLVLVPWLLMPVGWHLEIGTLAGLGGPLIVLGAAGLLRCFWDFAVEGRGTPAPIDPPRELVAHGLYRVFRNPMYVMIGTALVGEALMYRSGELLAWVGLVLFGFHVFVVLYEEPGLRRRFGGPYEEYLASTPRWRPGPGTMGFWHDAFPRAVGIIYTAGTVVHVCRLAFGLRQLYIPWEVDWAILLVGAFGGLGLVRFRREIAYRGAWEHVVHWLTVVHLLGSVALHAYLIAVGSHTPLDVFPLWYSGVAAGYFALFAVRGWTLRLRPS